MKHLEGYAFLAHFGGSSCLFGPGKNSASNLSANGLQLYSDHTKAAKSAKQYFDSVTNGRPKSIEISHIVMDIAPIGEASAFISKPELIVVAHMEKDYVKLLGQYDGKNSFCNGIASELTRNNFTQFKTGKKTAYNLALNVAQEFAKQTQGTAELATFLLKNYSLPSL